MDYQGKVAIVTGASSGIGRETALELARRGATVVGVARRERRLRELVERMHEHGPRSSYIAGDLSERDFAERCVEETVAREGRLDILVNNAARPFHKQIYDVTPEEIENLMRVNFLSCVWTSLAAIPHMLQQPEAYIVNVSSFASKVAPPRETAYTASKSAMDGFTEGLWTDLRGSGIHAALITPGPIDTEIWGKDDTPSGYTGRKHPPAVVVRAIMKAIDKRKYELTAPRWSLQLMTARLIRALSPALLCAGMSRMEPVPVDVIAEAKRRAGRPPG